MVWLKVDDLHYPALISPEMRIGIMLSLTASDEKPLGWSGIILAFRSDWSIGPERGLPSKNSAHREAGSWPKPWIALASQ